MADYIYLLQTRLTAAQQAALLKVREVARARNMTIFLVGGAVRDLTSGSPVRDLDVVVQGKATNLRKDLAKVGARITGEDEVMQSLYISFPGGVRFELGSTLTVSFPKPGKPAVRSGTILEDLRRRDFTANAMAISLNDGSYGLLMDPLNGVADIENRELRLVSNYGFIEEPSRMIRAARLQARLGFQLEERTQQRYETGKTEGYISALNPRQRSYELEEIFHEEDPLRVIRRLEAEGWMSTLLPALSSAKVNEAELDRLRDTVGQMEQMGIHPDPSAAAFPLLTAKLGTKEVAALTSGFARPGFAEQIAELEGQAKTFAAEFTGKAAAAPSEAWKLLFSADPEAVLWLAHTSKSNAVQAKFKAFFNDWSQAKQKIPYQLMQEMRITPDLPGYEELLQTLFFAIMDAKLETPEAAKVFLEPYSPPAPPPPVNLRRRPVKREGKTKARSKKGVEAAETHAVTGAQTDGVNGEAAAAAPTAKSVVESAKAVPTSKSVHSEKTTVKKIPAPAAAPSTGTKKVSIVLTESKAQKQAAAPGKRVPAPNRSEKQAVRAAPKKKSAANGSKATVHVAAKGKSAQAAKTAAPAARNAKLKGTGKAAPARGNRISSKVSGKSGGHKDAVPAKKSGRRS